MLQGQPGILQECSKDPAVPHCQHSPISMSTGFCVRVSARKQIRARRQTALEPLRWQFRRVTLTAAGSTDIHADTWMIQRDLRDTVTSGISSRSCGERDTHPALPWILSQGKLRLESPGRIPEASKFSQEETEARRPFPLNVPMTTRHCPPGVSALLHVPIPGVPLWPGCPCPRTPDPYSPQHYSRTMRPYGHIHQPIPIHVHPSVHADPEIPEAPPQGRRLDALGARVVSSPVARPGLCSPQR